MLGTHNWGHSRFLKEVFNSLEVRYTSLLANHLDSVNHDKKTQQMKQKTAKFKRNCTFKKNAIEKNLLFKKIT